MFSEAKVVAVATWRLSGVIWLIYVLLLAFVDCTLTCKYVWLDTLFAFNHFAGDL